MKTHVDCARPCPTILFRGIGGSLLSLFLNANMIWDLIEQVTHPHMVTQSHPHSDAHRPRCRHLSPRQCCRTPTLCGTRLASPTPRGCSSRTFREVCSISHVQFPKLAALRRFTLPFSARPLLRRLFLHLRKLAVNSITRKSIHMHGCGGRRD